MIIIIGEIIAVTASGASLAYFGNLIQDIRIKSRQNNIGATQVPRIHVQNIQLMIWSCGELMDSVMDSSAMLSS